MTIDAFPEPDDVVDCEFDDEDDRPAARRDVADPDTGRTRLLADKCRTCVFRPWQPQVSVTGPAADPGRRDVAAAELHPGLCTFWSLSGNAGVGLPRERPRYRAGAN